MSVVRYLCLAPWKNLPLYILLAWIPQQAAANVIINGTRVIYPQSNREVNIQLSNDGNKPSLIQAWVDNGDMDENKSFNQITVPFVLMPPIIRIEPNTGQTLRLTWTGSPLPQDKESLFWLNVLDIPPKNPAVTDANILQMAIRSRIKIFFRPPALSASGATQAWQDLQWQRSTSTPKIALRITNPSPYFINISSIKIDSHGKEIKSLASQMLAPRSSGEFRFNSIPEKITDAMLRYEVINDYGSVSTIKMTRNP